MGWEAIAAQVGGSALSGLMGSGASSDAAEAQLSAQRAALAEQRRQYEQTRTDQAPWTQAGSDAVKRLRLLLGLGQEGSGQAIDPSQASALYRAKVMSNGGVAPSDWTPDEAAVQDWAKTQSGMPADPAYGSLTKKFSSADLAADPVYNSGLQFGLDQGTAGINARAIATGGYDSGATLKALTRFGNDYGSTKANESYNRYNTDQSNVYNRLAGVSGSGQQAVNQVQSAGTGATNNISDLITQGGNASAAGIVGGANAWGSAAQGVNSAVNNYQNNAILQKLLAGRNSGSDNLYNGSQTYGSGYGTSDLFAT